MENMLSQKDWLDYVNRLQDRERLKIRSSGISNWILFVAIGGLGYWMFPQVQILAEKFNRLLLAYVVFMNISTMIFSLFNSEIRQHKIINFRLEEAPIIELITRKIMKLYELSIGIVLLVSNLLVYLINYDLNLGVLIPLIIIFFFNLVGFEHVFHQYTDMKLQKIEDGCKGSDFSLFTRLFKMEGIALVISLMPLISILLSYKLEDSDLELALFGFLFVLITLLFQFLIAIFSKRLKIAWLEQFEREIIINELTDVDIRNKLKATYFRLSHIDDYF